MFTSSYCLSNANLGITGQLHLHPVSEMHQLRPSLTYLDVLSRKNKRRTGGGGGSESDTDDGPPPDPDEPVPPPPSIKKEKKVTGEAREVQVSARKASDDKGGVQPLQGGLSTVRREMLLAIRAEEDEPWEDLDFCDWEVGIGEISEVVPFLTNEHYRRKNQNPPSKLCFRRPWSH